MGRSDDERSIRSGRSNRSSTKSMTKEEKARMNDYKKTAKALGASDKSKRLAALSKCGDKFDYLVAGNCLSPLLTLLAPKKKAEEVLSAALKVLTSFLLNPSRDRNGEEDTSPLSNHAYLVMRQMTHRNAKFKTAELLCNLLSHTDSDIQIQSLRCLRALVEANETFTGPSWKGKSEGQMVAQLQFHQLLIEQAYPAPKLLALAQKIHDTLIYLQEVSTEEGKEADTEAKAPLPGTEAYQHYDQAMLREVQLMALACVEFLCNREASQTQELLKVHAEKIPLKMLLDLVATAPPLQTTALRLLYKVCLAAPEGVSTLFELNGYEVLIAMLQTKLQALQEAGGQSGGGGGTAAKKDKGGKKGAKEPEPVEMTNEMVEGSLSEIILAIEVLEQFVVLDKTGNGTSPPEDAVMVMADLLALPLPRSHETVGKLWVSASRALGVWAEHSEVWRLAICKGKVLPLLLKLWYHPQGDLAMKVRGVAEKAFYHLCRPHDETESPSTKDDSSTKEDGKQEGSTTQSDEQPPACDDGIAAEATVKQDDEPNTDRNLSVGCAPDEVKPGAPVSTEDLKPELNPENTTQETPLPAKEAPVDPSVLGGEDPFMPAQLLIDALSLEDNDVRSRMVRLSDWLCKEEANAIALGSLAVSPLKLLLSWALESHKKSMQEDGQEAPHQEDGEEAKKELDDSAHSSEKKENENDGDTAILDISINDTISEAPTELTEVFLEPLGPPDIPAANVLVHTCKILLLIIKVSEEAWKEIGAAEMVDLLTDVLASGPLEWEDFLLSNAVLTMAKCEAPENEVSKLLDASSLTSMNAPGEPVVADSNPAQEDALSTEDTRRRESGWRKTYCKEVHGNLDTPLFWDWKLVVDQSITRQRVYVRAVAADLLAAIIEGDEQFSPPGDPATPLAERGLQADGSKLVMDKASSLCLNLVWVDLMSPSDVDKGLEEQFRSFDYLFCPRPVKSELELLHWDVKLAVLQLLANIVKVSGGRQTLVEKAPNFLEIEEVVEEDANSNDEGSKLSTCRGEWKIAERFMSWNPKEKNPDTLKEYSKEAWNYIGCLSTAIGVISSPHFPIEQHQAAVRLLHGLTMEPLATDPRGQPLLADILAGVTVSLGALVPLLSLQVCMMKEDKDILEIEVLKTMITSLISRGRDRAIWLVENPPEPVVDGKKGKKLAKSESQVSLAPGEDPVGGPKEGSWRVLLNSRHHCQRNSMSGATALLISAMEGNAEVVRLLLECGANPNCSDVEKGMSPLMYAVAQGLLEEAVKPLIASGADVDALNIAGDNILKYGILADGQCSLPTPNGVLDSTDQVQPGPENLPETLDAPENSSPRDNPENEMEPAEGGHGAISTETDLRMTKYLLGQGVDLNVADEQGNFPLHWSLTGISLTVYMLRQNIQLSYKVDSDHQEEMKEANGLENDNKKNVLMELLLQKGARLEISNKYGMSPLHTALVNGRLKEAKLLLARGCNPNVLDQSGCLPLHYACMYGWSKTSEVASPKEDSDRFELEEVVESLLKGGDGRAILNCEYKDQGKGKSREEKRVIAIEEILNRGWEEVVCPQSVIQRRVTENEIADHITEDGFSALHYACGAKVKGDPEEITKRLGDKEVQVSPELRTRIAELLISGSKADLKMKTDAGTTALHVAVQNVGHPPLVNLLLSAGANADALEKSGPERLSALHHALRRIALPPPPPCPSSESDGLKDSIAPPNAAPAKEKEEPENDREPFDTRQQGKELIQILLDAGASACPFGSVPSPLHLACEADVDPSIVKMMIDRLMADPERVAEVNYKVPKDQIPADNTSICYLGSPLHVAAYLGKAEILDVLLSCSAVDVNLADTLDFQTPLHMACQEGHLAIVQSLIEKGNANEDLRDNNWNSPLALAVLHNHADVTKYMLELYQKNQKNVKSIFRRSSTVPKGASLLSGALDGQRHGISDHSVDSLGPDTPLLLVAEERNMALVDSGIDEEAIGQSNMIVKMLLEMQQNENASNMKHAHNCYQNGQLYADWKNQVAQANELALQATQEEQQAATKIQAKQRQRRDRKRVNAIKRERNGEK